MNIVKPRALSGNEAAFEMDMRDLLQRKNSTTSTNEDRQAKEEVSALVYGISGQSIQHVEDLIDGLRGLRKRLDDEGGRLESAIRSYAAFSQSIVELADIVSEAMVAIKSPVEISESSAAASSGEGPAK